MAKRLVAAKGRRLAALALLAGVSACATSADQTPEAPPDGWRIVERTGEARYAPPGAATWLPATVGERLADGSEISTGRGGRLIVDAPGRHLSVGPDSRFVLPGGDGSEGLEQRAGWLRYRIAEADHPFRVHTRSLELELLAGVVDVHVNHLATEVTVKEGQVRVATPDGLRQTQMMAGQSASADGAGAMQLAVRGAPGAPWQAIEPVIVPALHPEPSPPATPPASVPAGSPPAGRAALLPLQPAPTPPGARAERQAPPPLRLGEASDVVRAQADFQARPLPGDPPPGRLWTTPGQSGANSPGASPREPARPGAPEQAIQPVGRGSAESEAAASRRGKFERVTAGMLDEVQPPRRLLFRP